MILSESIQSIHQACRAHAWVDAANFMLEADGMEPSIQEEHEAIDALKTFEKNLYESGRLLDQAVLLWGNDGFDSRPSTVRDIFKAINETTKLIIFGGSSLSKTFSAGVRFYQDWRYDPMETAVKLAAPNETALVTNLFSHIVNLHKSAAIPMTDNDAEYVRISEVDMRISIKGCLPEMGIIGILCKQSNISAGALRGHKPKPRKLPHALFGKSTRLRILIDEGTSVSPGAFEDIKTSEASISGLETVKIVMACNPEMVSSKIVMMAEPPDGWNPDQVDRLYRWKSAKGYDVLRLDGARFENVVQRKEIYPRMVTYDAALDFMRQGEHSAAYWAKFRGFPPLQDNAHTIIPPAWMQSQRGEPLYVGAVTNFVALDPAFDGADKAMMGLFRWGLAAGWTDANGVMHWFTDLVDLNTRKPHHALVLDQLFQLPKTPHTVEIIQEVQGRCKAFGIGPENVIMDRNGGGQGVWSHAVKFWGEVTGVASQERSSDTKVVAEDLQTAYDMYDGKSTELWFAVKRWLDPMVSAVFINPMTPTQPLFSQMTTRRYRPVKGGRVRVEPKLEYKARNLGASPDEADILCLGVEFVRLTSDIIPGAQEAGAGGKGRTDSETPSHENVDEPDYLDGRAFVANRLDMED